MIKYLKQNTSVLYLIAIVLLFPALLINLGLVPFITDEANRAVVALEMILSDNYIVPTITGEYYYKKPPLYNWIIIGSYHLFGNYSEFAARFPMILSLLAFGFTIYHYNKKYLGKLYAFITAFAFVTAGRMLFYESLMGLIDICYSWLTYWAFMYVFEKHNQKKYLQLFVGSYIICACAFLMKGFPTILFQGITLTVFFFYKKDFWKLFSFRHLAGLTVFFLITGSYYYAYNQQNSLSNLFIFLWDQSARRTPISHGVWDSIKHLLEFPIEMLFQHFVPWSILIVLLFPRKNRASIFKEQFIKYNAIILLFNIPVYWISPNVYPRFILMLIPLLFTVLIYLYKNGKERRDKYVSILEKVFLVASIAVSVVWSVVPFIDVLSDFDYAVVVAMIVFVLASVFTYVYFKLTEVRLLVFVIILLLVRIGFNFTALPSRIQADKTDYYKQEALAISQNLPENANICLYSPRYYDYNVDSENYGLEHETSFYIEKAHNAIIDVRPDFSKANTNDFFIINKKNASRIKKKYDVDFDVHHEFQIKYNQYIMQIVKLK